MSDISETNNQRNAPLAENRVRNAIRLLGLGFSVLPIQPPAPPRDGERPPRSNGKRPLTSWHEYQGRYPTEAEIRAWFEAWPMASLGVVTGRISGPVALDIDSPDGDSSIIKLGALPTAPISRTGRGRHVSGAHYRGIVSPFESALAPPPPWPMRLIRKDTSTDRPTDESRQIPEGTRNDTLYRLARSLRYKGLSETTTLVCLSSHNRECCNPALPAEEIAAIVAHAYRQSDSPKFSRRRRLSLDELILRNLR